MDRRRFLLTSLAGALATPLAAEAQQTDKLHRIGYLHFADGSFSLPYLKPALADLGYVEGKSLILETRFAHGSIDRLPALAAELVAAKVEMIMAVGDPAVRAAKDATKTIPIVMAFASLAVEHGFVKSLARPGGNITGVTVISDPEVDAKRIELLRDVAPSAKTVAMLQVAGASERESATVERATRILGVRLVVVKVRPGDYEAAFAAMKRERADALFVGRGPAFFMAPSREQRASRSSSTQRSRRTLWAFEPWSRVGSPCRTATVRVGVEAGCRDRQSRESDQGPRARHLDAGHDNRTPHVSRVPSGVCDVAEDRPMIAAIYARKSTDRFEPVLSA